MSAPAFLTEEEMRELTGRAMHKRQREWLQAAGWKFTTNAAGRPIVSRAHMEAMLGGAKADTTEARIYRPNFDAIR